MTFFSTLTSRTWLLQYTADTHDTLKQAKKRQDADCLFSLHTLWSLSSFISPSLTPQTSCHNNEEKRYERKRNRSLHKFGWKNQTEKLKEIKTVKVLVWVLATILTIYEFKLNYLTTIQILYICKNYSLIKNWLFKKAINGNYN